MCEEIGINLSCFRSIADRNEMLQKWTELSTYNTSKTIILFLLYISGFFFICESTHIIYLGECKYTIRVKIT